MHPLHLVFTSYNLKLVTMLPMSPSFEMVISLSKYQHETMRRCPTLIGFLSERTQ